MSRGRRYNNEPKLNIKKVIAVIVAIIMIIMFIIAIRSLIKSDFSNNDNISTAYFLINKDSRWGVMDNNSKIIIEPTYKESIIIPNSQKDIFICTEQVNYEENTYHTKVLNSQNRELFKEYDKVQALENYDENHNLWYEDNVLLVQKDGKYGLVDFDGNKVLETNYDKIETLKGVKNRLITIQNEKQKLVNCAGKPIINNEYQAIMPLGKEVENYIIKENNKYGVNNLLECKYEEIKPFNNNEIFCVKENGKYKVINREEKVVFNEKFDNIEAIQNNVIIYQYNKKYSAYDLENDKKLGAFYKDLIYTGNQLFIAKTKDNYGIIDMNNQTKIKQEYTNIHYYPEAEIYELEKKDATTNSILNANLEEMAKGIVNKVDSEKNYIKIWTETGYEYYNLRGERQDEKALFPQRNLFLSKQNGKYGFVNKDGKVVVDYVYDDAIEQNEFGYAAVKKDGLWGCIDKDGNIICETKYNLENHLLIDFIGPYYLGIDLNLMYYTNKMQ